MMWSIRSVVGILALVMVGATSAHAQHAGDLIIGSAANGGGALKISFDFSRKVVVTPSFTSGGFTLYTTTDPGFDAVVNDDPANAFYALDTNTPVRVELTAIAPLPPGSIFSMKFRTVTIDAVGESALDGTMPNLHYHPTWGLYLPNGVFADYPISFKLTTTAAGYSQSVSYAVTVTNILPSATATASTTATPSATPTIGATPTMTASVTPTASATLSVIPTPTSTPSLVAPTFTPNPAPTATPIVVTSSTRNCRTAIIAAAAKLVQAETNAESACHAKIVAGKLPSATPCRDEPATATAIARARAKLVSAIGKACGGKDKTCGAGGDDVPLAEVGWQIGSCPNVKEGACANAITDCGDVAACVTCIGESTLERSMSLYYGALEPTDPSDKTQKPLNQCQSAIGKAGRGLLNAEHNALAKCWTAVSAGKATGTCPATDAKAMAAIAKAEAHAGEAICKACGGTDKACGTPDDFTPTAIGFVPTCPDITPPGAASCNGTIATLQDLVACSDCGASFGANCALLATVPGLATYPDECAP